MIKDEAIKVKITIKILKRERIVISMVQVIRDNHLLLVFVSKKEVNKVIFNLFVNLFVVVSKRKHFNVVIEIFVLKTMLVFLVVRLIMI